MAGNEEGEETAPRGKEWEVVSLTQSAYAAAPGPKQIDTNDDNKGSGEYVAETSHAMFMSGHFLFPPSQHENLPLEPDNNVNDLGREDATPEFVDEEGSQSDIYEESTKTKGLSSPEFPGIQIFDERGNRLSISGAESEEDAASQYISLHSDEHMGGSAISEDSYVLTEPLAKDKDIYDAANLPCRAWWRRRASSLIGHAKDANAFWSIFITAAVMGLVIIGQRWQQERWQVLQMKWQFGVLDERIGRMFGPLTRLKDVIVGVERRGSLISGSTPAQH